MNNFNVNKGETSKGIKNNYVDLLIVFADHQNSTLILYWRLSLYLFRFILKCTLPKI